MILGDLLSRLLISTLLGLSAGLLVIASLHDALFRILPNWTSLALAIAGCALRLHDGTLPMGLGAALGLFLITYVCWRRGWVGGGDVKLLAACALLVPPSQVTNLVELTTLGGGVLAILYLAAGRLLGRRTAKNEVRGGLHSPVLFRSLWAVERARILGFSPLPYGCAIAGAALILLMGPASPFAH